MFPGCDRGVRWTEAHHLHHWEHGGPTDLDNGLLLCRRHHTLIHTKGWTIHRDPTTGLVTVSRPDGHQFHRRPDERC
jgi:predicted restriction endonuclease